MDLLYQSGRDTPPSSTRSPRREGGRHLGIGKFDKSIFTQNQSPSVPHLHVCSYFLELIDDLVKEPTTRKACSRLMKLPLNNLDDGPVYFMMPPHAIMGFPLNRFTRWAVAHILLMCEKRGTPHCLRTMTTSWYCTSLKEAPSPRTFDRRECIKPGMQVSLPIKEFSCALFTALQTRQAGSSRSGIR